MARTSLLPPFLQGAYFNQVRNTKKSSQRLREALVDANLSIPMLLLMGQQRDCIVYRDGSKRHLKLVGMLFDNVSAPPSGMWWKVTIGHLFVYVIGGSVLFGF